MDSTESELAKQGAQADSCDSNNNAGRQTSELLQSHQEDTEDWHILDADEHHHQGFAQNLTKTNADDIKANSSKTVDHYIELDPLAPDQGHSPALVHLCTAIYSLLPLASVVSALSLIALLFTRYYFVSLAYLMYVFLDKNTCNNGKFFLLLASSKPRRESQSNTS